MLVGFIYSNTTLQRVQLQSLEDNFEVFHRQIQRNINAFELNLLDRTRKTVQEEIAGKQTISSNEKDSAQAAIIRRKISAMNRLVSQLALNNPELKTQIDSLRSRSRQLLKTLNETHNSKADETFDNKRLNN